MQNPDKRPPANDREGDLPSAALSRRENEVVGLIALGLETPAIAKQLHISEHTVRAHVRHAMKKVGARTRAHLVALVLSSDPNAGYLWWPSVEE